MAHLSKILDKEEFRKAYQMQFLIETKNHVFLATPLTSMVDGLYPLPLASSEMSVLSVSGVASSSSSSNLAAFCEKCLDKEIKRKEICAIRTFIASASLE